MLKGNLYLRILSKISHIKQQPKSMASVWKRNHRVTPVRQSYKLTFIYYVLGLLNQFIPSNTRLLISKHSNTVQHNGKLFIISESQLIIVMNEWLNNVRYFMNRYYLEGFMAVVPKLWPIGQTFLNAKISGYFG